MVKNINQIATTLFILSWIVISGNNLTAGQVPANLKNALKNGDTDQLAYYFNNTIELVILDIDNTVSKNKAIEQIKKFFAIHIPNNFIILHEGGKEAYRYAIGSLSTSKGTYRVYFLLKNINGQDYIQQLRIEKSDE
jgi:hypothetical protein